MIVTPIAHGLDAHLLVESGESRVPGLHVSDLYGALYRRLDPKRYRSEEGNPLYLFIGRAFEDRFELVLRAAGLDVERPTGLVSVEGIPLSPDGFIFNGHDRIAEYKYTTMSVSETLAEDKFDKYKTQLKVYAHHTKIYRARIYIYFAVGNWRSDVQPKLRAFDIEMTPEECADEWQACVNVGKAEGLL